MSRSCKDKIMYVGQSENILDEIFKFMLIYTQNWPESY